MLKSIILSGVIAMGTPVADQAETVSSMLYELPRLWEDRKHEDDSGRQSRMDMFAAAQWDVSERLTCTNKYAADECVPKFGGTAQQLRRLLLSAGWWETRYGWRMHHGLCKRGECDSGKAVSVYQVHDQEFFPEGLWESAKGADEQATYNATLAAGLAFSQAWFACNRKHGILGVWSAYGRGNCTEKYPTLGGRVKWYFDLKHMP